ncbi:MAG: GlxA family transcriptional regulator [Desulfobacterales bacterium]|nr:GlxA family transcriptional regulator [Desulfobacterales bacterium]
MPHQIDFILFPGALGLDITGPLEVFSSATNLLRKKSGGDTGYRTRCVATTPGPVRLSSGLEIVADAGFDDAPSCQTLVVPGGMGTENAVKDPAFIDRIREKARQADRIVSVCTGAFILAAAGILDGRQATTHWIATDNLTKFFPRVKVVPDAIFTRDGNIYTSAGVTAGIDLALALVEADFGASLALEVSRRLVVYFRRPGSQSQFSTPLKAQEAAGRRFARLHDWLLKQLDKPISVERMAEHAAMSPRNFSRVFKQKTGFTPTRYLETLRLDRAREILSAGGDSLADIAEACGFGREERLRRAFLRRFQVTPSQYRLHFYPHGT